jgi:tetratricopeptide (TPR) repeat protein
MDLEVTAPSILSSTVSEQGVSRNEAVRLRCRAAKKLEDAGDYEGASAALGDVWVGLGQRPKLDGLDEPTQAEVLLHAGTISAWVGHTRQVEGVQEVAKDLLFESGRTFERHNMIERLVDAQIQLGLCYWREGALDEARITFREVRPRIPDQTGDQMLKVLANLAIVERSSNRYRDAFQLQTEAAPLFALSDNHLLRGSFHNEFGLVLKNLARSEGRPDYIDRAFIEFTAASYHWDRAGNARYVAIVESNLGGLLLTAGKLVDAHQHLNRARALFSKLRDKGHIAQTDELRARIFIAERNYSQAEIAARGSVRTLEEGDEKSLLSEALTTHGIALARLGRFERAAAQFQRAIEMSEQAGAAEMSGMAALTMLEELYSAMPVSAMRESYEVADTLLAQTHDAAVDQRLAQCARLILKAERERTPSANHAALAQTAAHSEPIAHANGKEAGAGTFTGCALDAEVLNYEGQLIKRALEAANGSVTRAARMLGITHQGLAFILNGRHKTLLNVRTPVKRRRRSILRAR